MLLDTIFVQQNERRRQTADLACRQTRASPRV